MHKFVIFVINNRGVRIESVLGISSCIFIFIFIIIIIIIIFIFLFFFFLLGVIT